MAGYNEWKVLSDAEAVLRAQEMKTSWDVFAKNECGAVLAEDEDYIVHRRNLYEVLMRVAKRIEWFKKFHNITDACEYKKAALEAYWVIRLKPFMMINENNSLFNEPNERFALFRILTAFRGVFEDRYKEGQVFPKPSTSFVSAVLYDFKYIDLTEQAFILFTETWAWSFGVGMDESAQRN
jgi:hypothetical protein